MVSEKMKIWLARNKDGDLVMTKNRPRIWDKEVYGFIEDSEGYYIEVLDKFEEFFPDISYETGPKCFELVESKEEGREYAD